jgi:asparagine synthase (glutamine-hydrolysing)
LKAENGAIEERAYWTPLQHAKPSGASSGELRKAIGEALLRAVERRLVADVPFGAFLSGGIDSSAIVALMARLIPGKVNTFSVGFAERRFDEAHHARRVAQTFATEHHDIRLGPERLLELLPAALDGMDHPSGDGPNTYVVSKATRDAGVTMALSGLGGDELFAGYDIFTRSLRLQKLGWLGSVPVFLRKGVGNGLHALRPSTASAKLAGVLAQPDLEATAVYHLYRQVLLDPQIEQLTGARDGGLPPNRVERLLAHYRAQTAFEELPVLSQISIAEITTYMQHVLLRDTDQMSMAHALEVRVPFLDHELVELVLSVPDEIKYPHTPKQLLVESLGEPLPAEVVERPKMGFSLPFEPWMRDGLRGFCEKRLEALAERAWIRADTLNGYWNAFRAGEPTLSWSRLWMLVVLEHWLQQNRVE